MTDGGEGRNLGGQRLAGTAVRKILEERELV